MDDKRLDAIQGRGEVLRQDAADADVRGEALRASARRAQTRAEKLRAIPIKTGGGRTETLPAIPHP